MRTNHRPLTLAAAVAAVLLLTSACGGSDDKDSSGTTPEPLSSAKAQAVVKAGVLTAADMPGFKAEDAEPDPEDDKTDERVATCLGVGKPTYVARNPGRNFTKGQLEVESTADVAPSAAVAKAELEAFTSDKAEGCLKAEFAQLVSASGATITTFELTPQTITVDGADEVFAYKLDFAATLSGQTLAFSGFTVGALVGQAELEISGFDPTGSAGFTLDQATTLLQKVTDRTKAAL